MGKLQRLPILHHEGFSLGESVAIFRYLTKQSEIADPWYPLDVHQRARVDEYLSWTHNNIRVAVGQFIYAKWRDPLMTGKKTDEDTVKYLEKHLDKALDEMNDIWLENGFMAGDKLTVADIFAACDLEQISEIGDPKPQKANFLPFSLSELSGKDAFVGRDRLTNWYKRVVPILEPHFTNHSRFVHKHAEKRMMSSTK